MQSHGISALSAPRQEQPWLTTVDTGLDCIPRHIYIDTEILIPRDVCVFDFLIGVVPAI